MKKTIKWRKSNTKEDKSNKGVTEDGHSGNPGSRDESRSGDIADLGLIQGTPPEPNHVNDELNPINENAPSVNVHEHLDQHDGNENYVDSYNDEITHNHVDQTLQASDPDHHELQQTADRIAVNLDKNDKRDVSSQKTGNKNKGVSAKSIAHSASKAAGGGSSSMNQTSEWKPLVEHLREKDLFPTIVFCFSKNKCELAVESLETFDLLPNA